MLIRSIRSKLDDEEGALFDSGFDGGGPFRVTPEAGGVSLESALRDFGPAAIDDLLPRLRAIADALDAAHAAHHVHGALHPSKVIIRDEATSLIAGTVPVAPYAAPEMADGTATPASDQFGLAAIAYEWLFGRPIGHPADRPVEVRTMPGVDRVTLSKAFTRALAPRQSDRFASCTEFCSGVAAAVVPELPLLASDSKDDLEDSVGDAVDSPGDLHKIDAIGSQPDAVASWNPSASSLSTPVRDPQRFGGFALIIATLVGAVFGFAAGYMARPRALQSGTPQEIAMARGTEAPISGASGADAPSTSPQALKAPEAPKAPEKAGRLLVRSTPSGASVVVDGVAKGVTPLALGDLATGTLSISVARRGYIPETRKVVITSARPARSLDVRLAAEAAAPKLARPAARQGGPATPGKPAAATGAVNIDSRPAGAAVTINGKPSGNTPLTIDDLSPGDYRILMAMPGYRDFATTVRVVAGERVRAAASLTAQEKE